MPRRRLFSVVLCAFALYGCTPILSSVSTDYKSARSGGTAYSLPLQLIRVRLSDVEGALQVQLDQPISVADPEYTYLLSYSPSPLSDDTIDIDSDPKTGLLTKIGLTAADRTDDIIVEIAKSAAVIFEATTVAAGRQIFSRLLDPSDDTAMQNLINEMNSVAIANALQQKKDRWPKGCPKMGEDKDKCNRYASVATGKRHIK